MIIVRFDIYETKLIGYAYLPAVPGQGDIINLNGHPYMVHHVGWAVDELTTVTPDKWEKAPECSLFAYVDLIPYRPEPK